MRVEYNSVVDQVLEAKKAFINKHGFAPNRAYLSNEEFEAL